MKREKRLQFTQLSQRFSHETQRYKAPKYQPKIADDVNRVRLALDDVLKPTFDSAENINDDEAVANDAEVDRLSGHLRQYDMIVLLDEPSRRCDSVDRIFEA
jgi:hypothetical protein